MLAVEEFVLANFVRLLAVAFLLVAAIKIVLLSRESSWDGWSLMSISAALLAVSILLGLFKQFGIYLVNVREVLAVISGVLAASAFLMSTRLIKKPGGKE